MKARVYAELARIGKAVSTGARIEILDLLAQGPRTVESIANEVRQSIANTSHHLQTLRRAGLVDSHKQGLHVSYRLASDDVASFVVALRRLGHSHLDEVGEIIDELGAPGPVLDPDKLDELVGDQGATFLDVRPRPEFESGHLPGAISIPVDELDQNLELLSKENTIVAYCRGPYCDMAADAVDKLRNQGFRALRLELGVADWRASRRAMDTSS